MRRARPLFGTGRLDEILKGCRHCSAEECPTRIRAAVAEFTMNAPAADDQTLIAMRCLM